MTIEDVAGRARPAHGTLRLLLVAIDAATALAVWSAVLVAADKGARNLLGAVLLAGSLTMVTLGAMAKQRLYLARVCAVRAYEIGGLARACAFGGGLVVVAKVVGRVGPSEGTGLAGAGATFIALGATRALFAAWLRRRRAAGAFSRPVCILGVNDEAEELLHLIEGGPEVGYRVVAVLGDPAAWGCRHTGIPAVEPGEDLAGVVAAAGASGVVIARSAVDHAELGRLVGQIGAAGLHVQISLGLGRVGRQRMTVSPVMHQVLLYVEPRVISSTQLFCKRVLDLIVAAIALLLTSPLLLIAALGIALEDGRPILFRQRRVGRGGVPFEILKLRTMVPDAADRLAALRARNERDGPLFKLTDDPRVTRVGRWLRATSVDELPQLLNVLRGQMSLVGPRPALPDEVAQFDDELLERSAVSPGITGLWQVEASHQASFDAYRRLDLFYVDNWSVAMDIAILAATAGVVLRRASAAFDRRRRAGAKSQPVPSAVVVAAAADPVGAQLTVQVG